METFVKTGDPAEIWGEALSLAELAEATPHGGAPVVPLLSTAADHDRGVIREERLRSVRATALAAREFGARLARTHAWDPSGHRIFGQAPGSAIPASNTISPDSPAEPGKAAPSTADRSRRIRLGSWDLPVVPADFPTRSFGEFYAADRIEPYLGPARDNCALDASGTHALERLCERLRDGTFDSPQPALVHSPAALLHGDLWSGNVMWTERGGMLIDPVSHGGHAETDLATLTVFRAPFAEEIYAGYNEVSPLASGWQHRIGLHSLHILILHAALFGGSYGAETLAAARPYL
ncbi:MULTISPECIES: fructosamine kinase family protein [Actinotignum]|uniref:Fructosamine kinase family protein n=3 Tax=Actinotignum timonense TaxID=1870995 RepID=A0AAW9HN15_9ACTO|nr:MULTISPECIES: fructosamine kinase family protein [Actinotignum]MDE1558365.1 fructosamine kinase family protein [Actinotignum schaalii]MDE1663157.1 fructosamine kinase family protein [Actinotignum schaalii]MDK6372472.1 fructosamine kinase family protein [Actinotignum timonense]MDK6419332.1 fructosamine kinase family protein [Actinotignum timonense]MDK6590705.1 fructosamine kinase family protein [Actinotignum timonense]